MIDLDREMRALLDEDARHAPPVPEAAPTLRRTRRRQVVVVLTAAVVVAAVAVGSITGVSALVRSSEHRVPAEPPETSSRGPLVAVPIGSKEIMGMVAVGRYELWTAALPSLGGAWRLLGDSWTHFAERYGLAGEISDLALAPDGVLWATSDHGVWRFDGSRWEQVMSGNFQAIAFGPDRGAWVGHKFFVQRVGGNALPGKVPPMGGWVGSLAVLADDDVWAASDGAMGMPSGLAHFDGRTWTAADPLGGDTDFSVSDIEVAPNGDVWVSIANTDSQPSEDPPEIVVARFDGTSWQTYRDGDGVPFGTSWDASGHLEIAPDGTPVVAAASGLMEVRDGAWTLLQEGSFRDFSIAPDGTVWVSGDDGLFRIPAP
jgi:hypothetical protein